MPFRIAQTSAEDFFGLGSDRGGPSTDVASQFFGLDNEPRREPRRRGRGSPPLATDAPGGVPPPQQPFQWQGGGGPPPQQPTGGYVAGGGGYAQNYAAEQPQQRRAGPPGQGRRASPPLGLDEYSDASYYHANGQPEVSMQPPPPHGYGGVAPAMQPRRPRAPAGDGSGNSSASPPLSGAVGAPPPPPIEPPPSNYKYMGSGVGGSGRGESYADLTDAPAMSSRSEPAPGSRFERAGVGPPSAASSRAQLASEAPRGPSAGRRREQLPRQRDTRPEWNNDFVEYGALSGGAPPAPAPAPAPALSQASGPRTRSTSGRRRDTGSIPDAGPGWSNDFTDYGSLGGPAAPPSAAQPSGPSGGGAGGAGGRGGTRPEWLDGQGTCEPCVPSGPSSSSSSLGGGRRQPSAGGRGAASRDERPVGSRPSNRDERPVGGGGRGGAANGGGSGRDVERAVGGAQSYEQMMSQYGDEAYGAPPPPSNRRQPRDPERPVGGGGAMQQPAQQQQQRGNPERALPQPAMSYEQLMAHENGGGDGDGGLVPCSICGRKFAASRIEAHSRACQRQAEAKPRKAFVAAKQRIGQIEGVNQNMIREAARAEEAKAKAKAELARDMGAAAPQTEQKPRTQKQVMLGKDGRPLSPLSAAIARKKAGLDPYEEDTDEIELETLPCPCCGRNFHADRLEKHLEICRKSQLNAQQRGTWNSQSQRLDSSAATFSASPPMTRSRGPRSSFRASHTPIEGSTRDSSSRGAPGRSSGPRAGAGSAEYPFGGGGGGGGGGGARPVDGMPANKPMPKWQRDRQALRRALEGGRALEKAKADGVPAHLLPPPPQMNEEEDDRVPCPHCGRKFNSTAAERHIPKCTSIRAKPKTLMRGMPAGGPNRASGGRTPTQYVL